MIHTNLTRTNLRELSLRNFVTANAKTLGRVIYFKMDLAIQRKLNINSPLEAAKPNLLANIDGFPI